jgi:hypothetical protein
MARKRYKPEEIVAKLRHVDVLVSQGQNMMDAIRQIGVSEDRGCQILLHGAARALGIAGCFVGGPIADRSRS